MKDIENTHPEHGILVSQKDFPEPGGLSQGYVSLASFGVCFGVCSRKSNFPTLLEVEQTCKNNTQGLRSQHSSAAAAGSCFEDMGKKHPLPTLHPQQTKHKTL